MANLEKIVKLRQDQYNTLKSGSSITINGQTYTYDANTIYLIQLSADYLNSTNTVNGKPLSSNITLSYYDVGAASSNWFATRFFSKCNNKTGDVTLTASDIGALPSGSSYVSSLDSATGRISDVVFRGVDNHFTVAQTMYGAYIHSGSDSNGSVDIFMDTEGGNIDFRDAGRARGAQMDLYNNSSWRVYLYNNSPWTYLNDLYMTDGGFTTSHNYKIGGTMRAGNEIRASYNVNVSGFGTFNAPNTTNAPVTINSTAYGNIATTWWSGGTAYAQLCWRNSYFYEYRIGSGDYILLYRENITYNSSTKTLTFNFL